MHTYSTYFVLLESALNDILQGVRNNLKWKSNLFDCTVHYFQIILREGYLSVDTHRLVAANGTELEY